MSDSTAIVHAGHRQFACPAEFFRLNYFAYRATRERGYGRR